MIKPIPLPLTPSEEKALKALRDLKECLIELNKPPGIPLKPVPND